MIVRPVYDKERGAYNASVTHPMQSWEWGEFRKKTGVEVVRLAGFEGAKLVNGFQMTIHDIPRQDWRIGYVPKSVVPSEQVLNAFKQLADQKKILFVKFEPNEGAVAGSPGEKNEEKVKQFFKNNGAQLGRPLFTKHTFRLDLTGSEEELLVGMKSKTRYNVRLAQKRGVEVKEDGSDQAFEYYLRLTFEETTKRQGFYAHSKDYHRKMWESMRQSGIGHMLVATYQGKVLVTWVVFVFNGVLYYPYGASSNESREVMASNLMMWEAIRFGKKMGCRQFDMWGSLGSEPDRRDPWYGFHRFKEGYGPSLFAYVGTYDVVMNERWYKVYRMAEKWRWRYLRLRAKLRI